MAFPGARSSELSPAPRPYPAASVSTWLPAGLGSGTSQPRAGTSHSPSVHTQNSPVSSTVVVSPHGAFGAFFPEDPEDTEERPSSRPLTSTETPEDSAWGADSEQSPAGCRSRAVSGPFLPPAHTCRLTCNRNRNAHSQGGGQAGCGACVMIDEKHIQCFQITCCIWHLDSSILITVF